MKLFNKLKANLLIQQPKVDPVKFGDPLALQTAWTPAKSSGANFTTHRLCRVHQNRLAYRSTWGARIFAMVFIAVGLIPIIFLVEYHNTGKSSSPPFPFFLFFPIMLLAGCFIMVQFMTPIVFDLGVGYFWKGWKAPNRVFNTKSIKCCAPISEIHALQLIPEICKSDKSTYLSYELNIILSDATRLHVVEHSSKSKMLNDAQTLAAFLGKPLWDAT